jgi:hypothetical protein
MSSDTPAAGAARAAVDAILARDGLRLSPVEYERLIAIYAEVQAQMTELRGPEFAYLEPAVIYHPT